MAIGRCKDCKWWAADKRTEYVAAETDAAPCHCPQLINIDEKGYGAVAGNGFGLDYPVCELFTGPEFGCVHWEGK